LNWRRDEMVRVVIDTTGSSEDIALYFDPDPGCRAQARGNRGQSLLAGYQLMAEAGEPAPP
jgi:hypothetical protein